MSDLKSVTHYAMRALVHKIGCFDAVAAVINARWGGGASKGTISKKMNGQLDWTVADVIAVQDAAGDHSVTRILARAGDDMPSGVRVDPMELVSNSVRESAEAIGAVLSSLQSGDDMARAEVIVEIDQAIDALAALRVNALTGGSK